jgi:1-acyl-sn-glycerol-3-phosphate acyltransferase
MNKLTLIYDPDSESCVRARWWMIHQSRLLKVECFPAMSAELARRFPDVRDGAGPGEILIVDDEGGLYAGDSAWVMFLYALEEFRTGVFLAAVKVGAPIVPITIRGSRRVLSPRSWHMRPGRVELILDPPIATEGMGKERLEELVAQVRQIMERNYQGAPA